MSEASEQRADDGPSAPTPEADDRAGENTVEDRAGVHNLLRALAVRTQVKRGFTVGLLVAVATYWFFVVASGGSPYSTPYLVALAGVLAFTAGLLATLAFTAHAAYRLSQRLD